VWQVLLTADEEVLQSLPAALVAEATALRERHARRAGPLTGLMVR
jgi:hypothetical protein